MTKPYGDKFGWKLVKRVSVLKNKWCEIVSDDLTYKDSQTLNYTYLVSPGAAFCVPVTKDSKIVLIRNYRWTIDDECWEVPAGLLDHPTATTPEEVAKAEMKEEAGCEGGHLSFLGQYYSANGVCRLNLHIYIAEGVSLGRSVPEETETILEIKAFDRYEIDQMLNKNEIKDGDSVLAVMLALRFLDAQEKK